MPIVTRGLSPANWRALCGPVFWIALAIVGCRLVAPSSVPAQDVAWDQLAEGLAVTVWEPGAACGQVSSLYMVKVDPKRFRFATYHFRAEGLAEPLTLPEWRDRTKAAVLFNAGLFREDYSYMGLLYKDGRSLGSKRHPQWQALFVAEPDSRGEQQARIMDLSTEAFDPDEPSYREAAQSLMLLDRTGKPRTRRSGRLAQQTVVGEDRHGHILIVKSSQKVSLWELATCLRDGFRELIHAMAMDGGDSSDVLIATEVAGARRAGEAPAWQVLIDGSGWSHIALPAVIGVFPRK